jgi:hypothetical protein
LVDTFNLAPSPQNREFGSGFGKIFVVYGGKSNANDQSNYGTHINSTGLYEALVSEKIVGGSGFGKMLLPSKKENRETSRLSPVRPPPGAFSSDVNIGLLPVS